MTTLTTQHEVSSFGSLPGDVRAEVDAWLAAFQRVLANPPHNQALRGSARELGRSFDTVKAKFYRWLRGGQDWRVLVNRAKNPIRRGGVSDEFLDWYLGEAGRNQRSTYAAHRSFARRWKAGEEIPGLDNSLPRWKLPPGCSYARLQKHIGKRKFALKVLRQGVVAAKKLSPQVFTTRADCWVGSHYFIDDVWHDNFVIWQGQLVRVLELGILDGFSASRFAWGCKPRQLREDGKFDNLKEKFARLLSARALFQDGFSARGTTICDEHGTSHLGDEIAALLADRMGKIPGTDTPLIQVKSGGIIGDIQAVLGLGRGRGGGNPAHKSPLEALHSLIHNEMAALPAQTGRDVEHRPEFLHGVLKTESDLLAVARVLARVNPGAVEKLRTRLMLYHEQFLPVLAAVYDGINRRGEDPEVFDHALEGWSAAGLRIAEFRYAPDSRDWLPQLAMNSLAPVTREAFLQHAAADSRLLRERNLSPREVFAGGRGLQKIPSFVAAEMVGRDFAREEKCENSYFEFQDEELAPNKTTLRFEARVTTPFGTEEELAPDKYLITVNPFDLAQVFVYDARERFLGFARRDMRASRADVAAVEQKFHRQSQRFSDIVAPVKRVGMGITREETARLKANNDNISAALREVLQAAPEKKITADCTEELLARADAGGAPDEDKW